MTSERKSVTQGKRIHWLDNLRTVMILLVVLYHVGGVYEAGGLWGGFWIVDDPTTITWVGIIGILFDVTMMPVVFFVSGYLAPVSLKGKSAAAFAAAKAKRLLIPWLVAVLTLIPLYKVIYLYSRGLPPQPWTTYSYITNPNSQNWLWFLPVLFVCNMLYLALDKGVGRWRVSLSGTVAAATAIAFGASMVIGGVWGFRSWTLTPVLDFENERVLTYLLSFLIGALCSKRGVFAQSPKSKLLYTIASSVAWVPVTGHIFVRLLPFFTPNWEATTLYRLLWFVSLHLSTLCMAYLMVQSFWRYVDRTGPVWVALSRNSFGVYIIHVIMIGVFGTLLMGTGFPAVAKYLLLIVLTYGASNLAVSGTRAIAQVAATRRRQSAALGAD